MGPQLSASPQKFDRTKNSTIVPLPTATRPDRATDSSAPPKDKLPPSPDDDLDDQVINSRRQVSDTCETAIMAHRNIWKSHPRNYGKGAHSWYVDGRRTTGEAGPWETGGN
jgi:hypothetical protein